IVGEKGTLLCSHDGGERWEALKSDTTANLYAVWGSGPKDLYVVGEKGTILHSKDGEHFAHVESGVEEDLYAVFGEGSSALVAGNWGTILRSSGGDFHAVASGTAAPLYGLGSASGAFYAVGLAGTIVCSNDEGASWEELSSGTSEDLYWLLGSA